MTKAKKVIIQNEETASSMEEFEKSTEEFDVESLFDDTIMQVDAVSKNAGLVEVIPLMDLHFHYGGSWYSIVEGRRQLLPEHIKDFLLKDKRNPKIKDIY